MLDVAPQRNSKILIIYKEGKKLERIPEKGISEAENVIDNSLGALFRGRTQELSPYRACSNHPFNGWL